MNTTNRRTAPVGLGVGAPSGDRCNPSIAEQEKNIMTQTTDNGWDRTQCASWCEDAPHRCDPACWGEDRLVLLSLEEGFPREVAWPFNTDWLDKTEDPPRLGAYPYRQKPGFREVCYLHIYRPSENDYLDLDNSVHLTAQEAVQLAQHLLAVAAVIDPEIGGAR
jgi:hypothetical protein